MPVSARVLIRNCVVLFFLAATLLQAMAWAAPENSPMRWSGKKTFWNRKTNRVELVGNAAVFQVGETLTADYILLDLNLRTLDARGNCIYVTSDSVITGQEMHFNLDTRTGTVIAGRVSNERFSLAGERINKLGPGRFQTYRGEYSTCHDCPQSWSLLGGDVDMEFEGYAYIKNVTAKIKDAPFFWMPYMILPLKTQRQTGFLFPKFGVNNGDFRIVQHFFWAINRSSDMTFGVGYYGGRGRRGEWEGRYQLSERSGGDAKFFYLQDSTFVDYLRHLNQTTTMQHRETPHRWGLMVSQSQELPWGFEQKLRLVDVSDNLYPSKIGDVAGNGDAYISSDLIFTKTYKQVSAYVAAKRFRNLLERDPMIFDPTTVQVYPAVAVTTNDRFLLSRHVVGGVTVGAMNFSRTAGPFDQDPFTAPVAGTDPIVPGVDPIREATRVSVTPSLYTTVRPWDVLSIVPSAEYRSYFYSFPSQISSLQRGYLLTRLDLSTQVEKVYETDDPKIPRIKHLFRPTVTYNRIPYVHENSSHPFLRQISYARENGFAGYNFDNYDIVPIDSSRTYANYFVPLGNSLSYGFTTQLIRRRGLMEEEGASYQRIVELRAGQTYNFRELSRQTGDRQPYSRLFSNLSLTFDKWEGGLDYTYVPYIPINENSSRHVWSAAATYVMERGVHQRILAFDRSFTLSYSFNKAGGSPSSNFRGRVDYSISDYFLPTLMASYDMVSHRWLEQGAGLRFQSPSRCWKFEIGYLRRVAPRIEPDDTGYDSAITTNFSLNLTGGGFEGVNEVAAAAQSQ